MSRTVRRCTTALLTIALLAGCVNAGDQPDDGAAPVPTQTPSSGSGLSHLNAPGATVAEENETRIFTFQGRVGAGPPNRIGLGPAGTHGGEEKAHAFEIDGSVGFVETRLQPLDGARFYLMVQDSQGRTMCQGSVTAPCRVNVSRDLTLVRWSVVVGSSQPDPDNPYRLDVTLHPRTHVPVAVRPGGLNTTLSFRHSKTVDDGAEPSLGLTSKGHIFVVAFGLPPQTLRSTDDGRTWKDVTPPGTTTTMDPMLYVDPWTDRVLVDHLYGACSYLSWSDDDGDTWITNPAVCGRPANDHQKLAVGSHPTPGNPFFGGTIYYSFTDFLLDITMGVRVPREVVVSRSLDGGLTWQPSVAVPDQPLHGTGGQPVADRKGNVYLSVALDSGGFAVSASHDHGATWKVHLAGDDARYKGGVALDAAGNVYGAYPGTTGVHVVASGDKGATWGPRQTISPPDLKSFVFADAVAGDEGRVAVVYYATADSAAGPNASPAGSEWHLYLSVSENANAPGATWVTTRVADPPVQVGSICMMGTNCPAGASRNLAEFIDVQTGPDGRIYIAYTDGCPEGCTDQSRLAQGIVAIQENGPRLFAEKAPWN